LARLKRERAESEQRVSLLRSDRVDPDMLDERARYQLDYANPRDLVGRSIRTNRQISKSLKIDCENVACVALRHSDIFAASRNAFMAV